MAQPSYRSVFMFYVQYYCVKKMHAYQKEVTDSQKKQVVFSQNQHVSHYNVDLFSHQDLTMQMSSSLQLTSLLVNATRTGKTCLERAKVFEIAATVNRSTSHDGNN